MQLVIIGHILSLDILYNLYLNSPIDKVDLRLRKHTQSMAVILYAAESLALLGLCVRLGGIKLSKSKLDTLGWSY